MGVIFEAFAFIVGQPHHHNRGAKLRFRLGLSRFLHHLAKLPDLYYERQL